MKLRLVKLIAGRCLCLSVIFIWSLQLQAQVEKIFKFDTLLLYDDIVTHVPVYGNISACVYSGHLTILYHQMIKKSRHGMMCKLLSTDLKTFRNSEFKLYLRDKRLDEAYAPVSISENAHVYVLSFQGYICIWHKKSKTTKLYALPYNASYDITEVDNEYAYLAYSYNYPAISNMPKTSLLKVNLYNGGILKNDSIGNMFPEFTHFSPAKHYCTIQGYTFIAEQNAYRIHITNASLVSMPDYVVNKDYWINADSAAIIDLRSKIPPNYPQMWIAALEKENFHHISKIYSLDKLNDSTLAVRYYHYMPEKDSLKPCFFIDIYNCANGRLELLKADIQDDCYPANTVKTVTKSDVRPCTWSNFNLFSGNYFIKITESGHFPVYGENYRSISQKKKTYFTNNKPILGAMIFKYQ